MSTSVEREHTVEREVGYPLEVPDRPNGPAVRALLRRTAIGAGVVGGIAVAASSLSKRPGTRAFALGALAPGAGYIYTRNPFRLSATLSARLGVTIPMLTSTLADSGLATMLHAFDPELAQRCWSIVRREFVDTTGPGPTITLRGWDAIDTGNYRKSTMGAFPAVMWAAAEMGDTELYGILADSLDRQLAPVESNGTRWYDELSTNMNAMFALSRFNPPGGYRALIADGPGKATLRSPVLEGAAYPDVLVASARSDGADLRLVLRPGAGPTRATLGVVRLVPGGRSA